MLFIDEPFYHSVALRLQLPGAQFYPRAIGAEPPMGPVLFLAGATYWLATMASPAHAITVVHVLTTLDIAATTVLLLVTSASLLGSPWAGFCAGLLYALTGTSDSGKEMFIGFSGLEHFQAPWLAAFVLLSLLSFRRNQIWLAIAAGGCLGVAALYKSNVVLLGGVPFVAGLTVWRQGGLPLRRAAWLAMTTAASSALMFATVPVYYAAIGQFGSWYFYNVGGLLTYAAAGGSWTQKVTLLALEIPLKPLLVAGVLYGVVVVPRVERSMWSRQLGLYLALTWLVLFVSLTPGHRKPHYHIQGLPAECLLIGMLVSGGWSAVRGARANLRPYIAAAYAAAVVLPLAYALYGLGQGWLNLSSYAGRDSYLDLHRQRGTLAPLVRYIQEHTAPTDLIYIHSEAPELYFLTQRLPAVSDPVGSWIAHFPSQKLADSLLTQLQASPPKLIVQLDYRRYGRTAETLQKWPQLASWIHQHYRETTYIDHAQIVEWQGPEPWRTTAANGNADVFLSALPPEATVQTTGWLRFDRNQAGHPLRIGTHAYERGIGTHALSRLTYRLDGAYRSFAADVGIDAATGKRGSAVFTVEVDGVAKFTSPLVQGGAPALPIEVDVSGARTLTLVVTPGSDGDIGDWADWAQARLIRANP